MINAVRLHGRSSLATIWVLIFIPQLRVQVSDSSIPFPGTDCRHLNASSRKPEEEVGGEVIDLVKEGMEAGNRSAIVSGNVRVVTRTHELSSSSTSKIRLYICTVLNSRIFSSYFPKSTGSLCRLFIAR